ncbi:MAG: acetyltransferase [Granulosicoccus sp.]|nr:acetyltransferase [Granulosicoccus sp.]
MTHYDVFNGDADGICALHQLRLSNPLDSVLITGVKRDIDLLKQVPVADTHSVTVLDISLDKNRAPLETLLKNNISVEYFDHHFAGDLPQSPLLSATINTAGNVCTGLLVDQHLSGAHRAWAVVAAYGDNLFDAAAGAARSLELDKEQLAELETLGTLMNYNGYGGSLDDLFFAPDQLYRSIQPYADPFNFIHNDSTFATLSQGYAEDMQRAHDTPAELETSDVALFIFPEDPFSRRVSGVYSNLLARENPDRAHALLSTLEDGAYLISVRAPLATREGADELCRQFETGGGRKAAAGINHLPASDLDRFTDAFKAQFSQR